MAVKKNPHKIFVQPRPDGFWEAKRQGAKRASAVEPTKADAKKRATDLAKNTPGGAEVVPKGRDGKIQNPNTIGRKDPNPPKDKKH